MSYKERKALAGKMSKVFKADAKMLSKEMQRILMDDLVTAFLNRLNVLTLVENSEPDHDLAIRCLCDTFELVHGRSRQG